MMTEQTMSPPTRPALSEIDFDYGQIRRDMLVRRVGNVYDDSKIFAANHRR